eukprot:scaffold80357_cov63-Phaeocystis_antarctica.AAC.3
MSFASPAVVVGGAPAGGGATTRAARPSSLNGLPPRRRTSSAGSRRKAGARATSAASPMPALTRARVLSRGRAPRPRAAASAEAPASLTCRVRASKVTAGSAPAPSPSASRCMPSGPAEVSARCSCSSAGSKEPSPRLVTQRCGGLVVSPQLRQQRLRRRPQLIAGAAQVHGGARLEHVAQLGEEDALLVTAQRHERHRGARRGGGGYRANTGSSTGYYYYNRLLAVSEHDPTSYLGYSIGITVCIFTDRWREGRGNPWTFGCHLTGSGRVELLARANSTPNSLGCPTVPHKLTLKKAFRTSPPDVAKRPVHLVGGVDPIWRVTVIGKVDLIANVFRLFGSYCIGANQGFQQPLIDGWLPPGTRVFRIVYAGLLVYWTAFVYECAGIHRASRDAHVTQVARRVLIVILPVAAIRLN